MRQTDVALMRKFFLDHFRRVIVLSLIPLAVLGSLVVFISDRYIRDQVEQSNDSELAQINQLAQMIPAELDSLSMSFDKDAKIKLRLQAILNSPSFSYEELEAFFYLRNVIDVPANSKPYIDSIYIYYDNPHGRFLSTRNGLEQLDTTLDSAWFNFYGKYRSSDHEFATELRDLPMSSGSEHAASIITVYKPFAQGPNGNYSGLIVMNVRPAYFANALAQWNKWENSAYYLSNRNGTPLVRAGAVGLEQLPAEIVQAGAALDDPNASGRYPYQNALVSLKPVPRMDWFAVSVIPTESLYRLPRAIISITVGLSLLSLVLSMLYALWFTRKNFRQIKRIVRTLDTAAVGDSSARLNKAPVRDVYEWIVHNIVVAAIEQHNLRVQLSERKAKMELLELKALQSQMNPHFMSNTLHSIYWKTFQLTLSPNDACRMIERLSDLLEYALRGTDESVLLADELTNVRGYVELQRTRFGERLQVLWDVDADTEHCHVVKISLQPLVENSIHIGLEANKQLQVKIKCRRDGTMLKVTVIDNGPGMKSARLDTVRHAMLAETNDSKHVGLVNTSKRLALHYGQPRLLRILSKPDWGTAVTLMFPQTPPGQDLDTLD